MDIDSRLRFVCSHISTPMVEPARVRELVRRVIDRDGSVVLVIGSGCSIEETGLPSADRLSRRAHDRLVAEDLLAPGCCSDPTDLEAVAQAVIDATGTQEALVQRLRQDLLDAPPSRGHMTVAALMIEGAVSAVLTINFDLALSGALQVLGGLSRVQRIHSHRDLGDLGGCNLIYLHGTVQSPWQEWILTEAEVENQWEAHWRGALARRVLTSPVVVFAGVGASVGALVTSLREIDASLEGFQVTILVDPGDLSQSKFFQRSSLTADAHWDCGFLDFAARVATPLHRAIVLELIQTAETMLRENWQEWPAIDLGDVQRALEDLGLVNCGTCRATWVGKGRRYEPWSETDPRVYAHLALAVARLASHSGTKPWFSPGGTAHFHNEQNGTTHSALLAHGGGTRTWSDLLGRRQETLRAKSDEHYMPMAVIAGGYNGAPPDSIAAHDITGEVDSRSIVEGADAIKYMSVDEIMTDPSPFFDD